MNHIDFSLILSSALTPITLISGVGLLLLTMSARYDHTTARVRQLLHADEMTGGTDPHLAEAIELIFHRAELLRKAILFVVLSAACAGLLVLTSTLGAIFDLDLDTAKHVFLLASVAMIVIPQRTSRLKWEPHSKLSASAYITDETKAPAGAFVVVLNDRYL